MIERAKSETIGDCMSASLANVRLISTNRLVLMLWLLNIINSDIVLKFHVQHYVFKMRNL
jgi:hypothetical protein